MAVDWKKAYEREVQAKQALESSIGMYTSALIKTRDLLLQWKKGYALDYRDVDMVLRIIDALKIPG